MRCDDGFVFLSLILRCWMKLTDYFLISVSVQIFPKQWIGMNYLINGMMILFYFITW